MSRIVLLLSLILFLGIASCNNDTEQIIMSSSVSDLIIEEPEISYDAYGIDSSNYIIKEGRIRRNQVLSSILENYNISYPEINDLLRNSDTVFDVREMKAGNNYSLYINKDSLENLAYMVYEHDRINHYLLDFTDKPDLTLFELPLERKVKYSSGMIESSLWNAMTDNNLHPALAIELSEIYAWSIDFFGLQKGDNFKIIYEEDFVNDESLGINSIIGVLFEHAGTEFYAIPLIQDGKQSYFDLEGNSLRKAFLKAPLRYSRISSRYSNSRMHPILRIRRPHHGVDYAAAIGTPVHAIGDGKVIMRESQRGSGRIVKIKHNSVYTTAYMHLNRFGRGITIGKYVKQGDVIGYVGSSGLSTGPHLDFRFYRNGHAVDPLKVKAPPVNPVSEENLEKFAKISSVILDLLNSI